MTLSRSRAALPWIAEHGVIDRRGSSGNFGSGSGRSGGRAMAAILDVLLGV
eukprot:CAMPEP_0180387744 /NCGR_PEP_ID=MMETSP0989-20121125/30414_1 /TAXON_ID=697907 /ORGANISM="non described non described, Strain CCMP2293" /LENGTH=50 /DNA_ID=CAMNT_0022388651 /DNA_START=261 /DNA_END=409 /DNA_ORIENTATION=-